MKKLMLLFVGVLLILSLSATQAPGFNGVPGATDKVPAATLICPFFEVGIDGTGQGEDTILMVTNTSSSNRKFHYHVWDRDGKVTDLEGNVDIVSRGMWVMPMKTLMASASAAVKSDLTVGNFYQGFMTIDMVSADTHDDPTQATYPFSSRDDLEGYIYYVNLSEGMANGIDMIPLENVSGVAAPSLIDFYGNSDGREQIDSDARECAKDLIDGVPCSINDEIDYLDARVYLTPAQRLQPDCDLYMVAGLDHRPIHMVRRQRMYGRSTLQTVQPVRHTGISGNRNHPTDPCGERH